MTQDQQKSNGPDPVFETWMKAATDFWSASHTSWLDLMPTGELPDDFQQGLLGRFLEPWQSAAKMFQAVSSQFAETETVSALFEETGLVPEMAQKMAATWWKGILALQSQWIERVGGLAAQTKAFRMQELDREAFKVWTEFYERELRKFLNMPQLGLTRLYQERASRVVDRFNLFQGSLSEFLCMIYAPVEKSLKVVQQEMEKLSAEGEFSEDFKDYYRKWIKVLEGHYMTLFNSPEYVETMCETLSAFEDFSVARREFLEDVVKTLPVPSQKDMDEVYLELLNIKKELRALKKSAGAA